jgi:D-glycero-D-manno-heptose 1,7-bisphosphate phosphatase
MACQHRQSWGLMQGIFLDRDGVINRERADYVKHWDEFEFLPGVLPALRMLATLAAPILVISNQSAIGRGLISHPAVHQIHQQALRVIREANGRIDNFFVCPHRPDEGCDCRKPKPGLLYQAANAYGLELSECIFIGDAITDFQAGRAAGCQTILVESGRQGAHLRRQLGADPSVKIVQDLAAAVELVMSEQSRNHG